MKSDDAEQFLSAICTSLRSGKLQSLAGMQTQIQEYLQYAQESLNEIPYSDAGQSAKAWIACAQSMLR